LILSLLPDWVVHRFFNPTRNWPPGSVSSLSFNMARHELNGVAVEAPFENARAFGPADHVDRLAGIDIRYYGLGLEIGSWEGVITHFRLVMDPASRRTRWEQRCRPATLMLSSGAGFSRLSRDTSENDVIRLFGATFETGPVGDDRVHTFITGGNYIDTYHDPTTGRLVEIDLGLTNDAATAASSSAPRD